MRSFRIKIFIILLFGLANPAYAGKLDDFESAREPEEKNSNRSESHTHKHSHRDFNDYDDEDTDSSFFGFIFELTFKLAWYTSLYGGQMSAERVSANPQFDHVAKRKIGEPLIPQYRFDMHYQLANTDVSAADFRFEYGEGPFGVQLRSTVLEEGDNVDHLPLNQFQALYRMSFGSHVGINMGIGIAQLAGNSRDSSLSMTFPIYYHPNNHFGLELKPGFHFFDGAEVLDLDYSAVFTRKLFSISLGYRELVKAGVDISGPYAGVSFHY